MIATNTSFHDADTMRRWELLLTHSDLHTSTSFQRPEWNAHWWKYYGDTMPHTELLLLRIDSEDECIAIAPLMVNTRRAGKTILWQTIRFLGFPLSPYTDIIVRHEDSTPAWRCIFELIERRYPNAWHEFDCVLPDHSLHSADLLHRKKYVHRGEQFLAIHIPEESSATGWSSSGLTQSLKQWRKENRYRWFFVLGYDEALSKQLMEYNIATFGKQSFFTDTTNRLFYDAVCRGGRPDVWYAVVAHDAPLSILMGFKHGTTLYHFLSGTTRQHSDPNMRLGLMNSYLLLNYMQQHGYQKLDLLRGAEKYKFHFGPLETMSETWSIVPPRVQWQYRAGHTLQTLRRNAKKKR